MSRRTLPSLALTLTSMVTLLWQSDREHSGLKNDPSSGDGNVIDRASLPYHLVTDQRRALGPAVPSLDRMGDEHGHTDDAGQVRRGLADRHVSGQWAIENLRVHEDAYSGSHR